ncbi:MAG TPA: cytochrome c [Gemmatimonadales bacterium]|nr:cytochrome c [Gemmatimonadales bacterium]
MLRSFGSSVAFLLLVASPLTGQQTKPTPPDSATIEAGKLLYEGRGLCMGCHGGAGEGMLGPTTQLNAGKEKWLHHDGSLAAIIKVISTGIDADHSVSGQVMPARGGSRLTDAQVRAVAAYVQVLHTRAPKGTD